MESLLAVGGKEGVSLEKTFRDELVCVSKVSLVSADGVLVDAHDLVSRHKLTVNYARVNKLPRCYLVIHAILLTGATLRGCHTGRRPSHGRIHPQAFLEDSREIWKPAQLF